MPGAALNALCIKEAEWAVTTIRRRISHASKYSVVASACLEADNVEQTLLAIAQLCAHDQTSVVGIRQIVNKDPSWPRNAMSDVLNDPKWQQGYALLATHGFSFDLQCNPAQFQTAATFLAQHPNTKVIVNHAGCFTATDIDNGSALEGLKELASLSHVYIKISMLCYTFKEWDGVGKGRKEMFLHVKRVIDLFGCDRCMFASNYPVDIKDGWDAHRLLKTFLEAVKEIGCSKAEIDRLFGGNAMEVYQVAGPHHG